jgi:hypothetical protein
MKSINRRILFFIFIIVELLLYVGFMFIDITGKGSYIISVGLKFTGIIMCFLYTMIIRKGKEDKADLLILRTALFFTVISDLFILMLDYYLIGLLTFCVVQSFYVVRLGRWRNQMELVTGPGEIPKRFGRNIAVTLVILGSLLVFKVKIEALVVVSGFYFISILFNVMDSVIIAVKSKIRSRILYAAGMVLFLLCDMNVGLFNVSGFVDISGGWFTALYQFAAVAMWMFYLPAQTLIALSGLSESM